MKQSHGPIVWDPFFKVNFTYIYYETGPYRLNWGTFPLPWLNGVIRSVFFERSQRELGMSVSLCSAGKAVLSPGSDSISQRGLRLSSIPLSRLIPQSCPAAMPSIQSPPAYRSLSLSLASSLFALSQWLACYYMDHQQAALFIMTEKETFKRGGTRRRHQYREAVCGFV